MNVVLCDGDLSQALPSHARVLGQKAYDVLSYGFVMNAYEDILSPLFWVQVWFLEAVLARAVGFFGRLSPVLILDWTGFERIESENIFCGF